MDNDNSHNVIIIGAGAAGIAAATKLYKNGIKNIAILEAENRIGGRIYSTQFGDSYVDLGAQWCHGEKGNIVYELTKDLNVLKGDDLTPKLYHSSLKLIDNEFTSKFIDIYYNIRKRKTIGQSQFLEKFVLERYKSDSQQYWSNDLKKLSLAEDCIDLLKKWLLIYEGAFMFANLPVDKDFQNCDGHQSLGWNGMGYKTILNILMQKFPNLDVSIPIEEKILLNKEVVQIAWNGGVNSDRATVNCADGSSYTADHVILTVSLGVLKTRYRTMFNPFLPIKKINAIETLGFDATGKIFFHFADKWWDEKFQNAVFVWGKDELKNSAKEYSEGPQREGRSWITSLFLIQTLPKNPNILLARISGEFLPQIEQCSNETIINGINYVLKKFLGDQYQNISPPDKIIRNNWYSNPNFCGAFSYQTVASQSTGISQGTVLSEPLSTLNGKPILLFAGEATNPIHYSTVHGAIKTGFREADRLINFYKQNVK